MQYCLVESAYRVMSVWCSTSRERQSRKLGREMRSASVAINSHTSRDKANTFQVGLKLSCIKMLVLCVLCSLAKWKTSKKKKKKKATYLYASSKIFRICDRDICDSQIQEAKTNKALQHISDNVKTQNKAIASNSNPYSREVRYT
jgi:hypothetical protein